MRECSNCNTILEDDELFCHECGAKQEIEESAAPNEEATPLEKKCIHCGETIEEDSAFCPFCGKSQVVEKVKGEEPESPVEEPETESVAEEKVEPEKEVDEENSSKKWIWILPVILLIIGGAWFHFGSEEETIEDEAFNEPDSEAVAETLPADSDVVEVKSARVFLEQFYKRELDEDLITKNVTANVLNKLKRDYGYDCPTNDCLATWVFTAYPAGADLDLEEGPIIRETEESGVFKVEFKYSGKNGEQKLYETRVVFLTVSEIDGQFLISDYKVEMDVVNQDVDTSEEESLAPHLKGNELSIRKLNEDDISELEPHELVILRNVVYAKYGLRFKNEELLKYFSQFSWYKPSTDDAGEIYNHLTEVERYNVEFIKEHE